jgi:hypothetical protein
MILYIGTDLPFVPVLTLQDTRSHLLDLHFGSNHLLKYQSDDRILVPLGG